jgi:pimeloyl-ACP methyl ester carboxylesterase
MKKSRDRVDDFRMVRLSQGTIRYREYGTGEPILFVHGLLVNGSLWRKVVPMLSERYRCIVPDWPLGSHEEAMNKDADLSPLGLARLISDFIVALNLKSVTLVANDTGGAICQILVTEYPERIDRLVLTNCDCFDIFPPAMFRPLQIAAHIPGFIFLLAQSLRFQLIRRSPMAFGLLSRRPIEPSVIDAWLRPIITKSEIRSDLCRALDRISPKYTLAAAKKLKNFKQPVLLAWAAEDRFFTLNLAEQLRSLFPLARLEQIQDSLTFVPEDQPERLAGLIADFMGEDAQQPLSLSLPRSRAVSNQG